MGGFDFDEYQKTSFSNPAWDPFVREGFEAFDKNDLPTALEFLRKATNIGCQSPLVYVKLALAYEVQGGYYSAAQYYELASSQIKSIHPGHRYAESFDENYGRALYMMGQMDMAVPLLEKAALKNNTSPWVLQLLGQHALTRGDIQKASFYYEKLLATGGGQITYPEQLDLYLQLARSFANGKNTDKAIAYYESVLKLDPQNQEAAQFISSHKNTGNMDKVFEIMEKGK